MKALEKKVAAVLLSRGALSEGDLELALAQYDGSVALPDLLAEMELAGAGELARARAEADGIDFVSFDEVVASEEALALLPPADAWKLGAVPFKYDSSGVLSVAFAEPSNVFIGDEIRLRAGRPVRLALAEKGDLTRALERYYGPPPERRASASSGLVQLPPRDGDAGSSAAVSTHRLHQQRMRALRQSRAEGQSISRMETRPFEESSDDTLAEMERARAGRGAYEDPTPPADHLAAAAGGDHAPAGLLARALAALAEEGAEEAAFEPGPSLALLRLRGCRGWRKIDTYPTRAHPSLVEKLREAAGLAGQRADIALDHQFLLSTSKGNFLATLYLEPTPHGERALLRVADTRPLLADPVGSLPLPREVTQSLIQRIDGRRGGLLLLTSPHQRDLDWFRCSLLHWLVRNGNRDALSLERPHQRRLPGVTSINCPTEEVLLASLANAAYMNPDILALCPVENGTILNRLFHVALGGTTVIAGMTAAEASMAHHCLHAARVEPFNLLRALTAHLHLVPVPALCPQCARPFAGDHDLPEWARGQEGQELRHATGCEACGGTGEGDELLLATLHGILPGDEEATLEEVASAERQFQTLARSGLVDPRLPI